MGKFLHDCDYLIHLVRCTIHDLQPQELPEGLSFEGVYQWGVYHHIANIAFYSVEKLVNKPEPQLYSQWQVCRDQAIVRDINQAYAAQEIREGLQDAGVRFMEVQGTKIKPLYPQPDWRTMSDIDFIIDRENVPRARGILETFGYECREVYEAELNAHRPPNINVEMHTEFFLEDCEYRQTMHSPFEALDDQGQCDLSAFYLYNILHIAKHYFYGGCGIRRALDVYYLNREYGPYLDQKKVQKTLEAANAADFAAEFGALANGWFSEGEENFPRSKMAVCIVGAGLHGSMDIVVERQMEKTIDTSVRFSKLRYLLRRFFGSREDLRTRYPVLERRKILYPFCWICRGFGVLKPKNLRRLRREVRSVQKVDTTEE